MGSLAWGGAEMSDHPDERKRKDDMRLQLPPLGVDIFPQLDAPMANNLEVMNSIPASRFPLQAALSAGPACLALSAFAPSLHAQTTAPMELVLEEVTITASAGENVVGSSSTVTVVDREPESRDARRHSAVAQ